MVLNPWHRLVPPCISDITLISSGRSPAIPLRCLRTRAPLPANTH